MSLYRASKTPKIRKPSLQCPASQAPPQLGNGAIVDFSQVSDSTRKPSHKKGQETKQANLLPNHHQKSPCRRPVPAHVTQVNRRFPLVFRCVRQRVSAVPDV